MSNLNLKFKNIESNYRSKIQHLMISKDFVIEEYDGGDPLEKALKKLSHGSQMCYQQCASSYNKTSGSRDKRIELMALQLINDYVGHTRELSQSINVTLHEIANHNIQTKINPNLLTAMLNIQLMINTINSPTKADKTSE